MNTVLNLCSRLINTAPNRETHISIYIKQTYRQRTDRPLKWTDIESCFF